MWWKRGLFAAVLVAGAASCSSSGNDNLVDGTFTEEEWTKIKTLSPLPDLPKDTTNKFADDAAAAALGQRLFFDKAFSGPIITGSDATNGGNGMAGETGKVGCVSCHQPENNWIDKRSNPNSTSLGTDWTVRNASTPVNASYYTWLENDGIRDSQWSDGLTDPEDFHSMNGSRLLVAHMLFKKYRADYDAIFTPKLDPALDPAAADAARFPQATDKGRPKASPSDPDGVWEKMAAADQKIVMTIFANYGKALQAFLRKLVSKNAPFDKYVAGTTTAIGAAEKRGLKLFIGKAGCVGCHSTPLLSDNKFHDTGIAVTGPHADPTETGRYAGIGAVLGCEFNSNTEFSDDKNTMRLTGLAATEADKGKWRTKGLREIALTAPYTHAGQFGTLTDVVKFYNAGGSEKGYVGTKDSLMKPLNLTDSEISDLVAFLGTLTGEPIPDALAKDTSAP